MALSTLMSFFTKKQKHPWGDPKFLTNYHGCMVPYPFYNSLPSVEKLDVQPGDIILSTFPKAGTTFMSSVIVMILNDGDPASIHYEPPVDARIPFIEFSSEHAVPGMRDADAQKKEPHPWTLFTHLSFSAIPEQWKRNAKIIYVAANPKETICKMHRFMSAIPSFGFDGEIDDTIASFEENKAIYSPFMEHVADFYEASQQYANIFFTSYEDMIKDGKRVFRKLAEFLGKDLTDRQIDSVVYHTSFEQVKDNKMVNHSAMEESGYIDKSKGKFMDEGEVGAWRNTLSSAQSERIDQWTAHEMSRLRDKFGDFRFIYE